MKTRLALLAALLLAMTTTAEVVVKKQVIASGGGPFGNVNFNARASIGQAQAGRMTNINFRVGVGYLADFPPEITDAESALPLAYEFRGNHPNPFNPRTTLEFALPESAEVRLRLYDLQGRMIRLLMNERLDAGYHQLELDGNGLSSGVYFAMLKAGDYSKTHKLVLLK